MGVVEGRVGAAKGGVGVVEGGGGEPESITVDGTSSNVG